MNVHTDLSFVTLIIHASVIVQAVILLYGVEFTAVYARLRREPTLAPSDD